MIAIWKREFRSYFQTITGWIYIAVVMAVFSLYYFANNLNYGAPQIYYSISGVSFIFLIPVSVLTMRSLSEDRRTKTDQLILTAPVSVGKIVTAKYLAMASVHAIVIVLMTIMALLLDTLGNAPTKQNLIAVFGFALYGLTCIAVGLFVSSLTESQIISAVLTFGALFIGYMMSSITSLISSSGNMLTKILGCYDLRKYMESFFDGCFSVTGLVYYVSMIVLFLFLTTQSIQKRRWQMTSKKLSAGVFSTGFIVIGIVVALVVNLIVAELPSSMTSIDLTSSKLYSLTQDTKDYLKTLDKDVTIYAIANEESLDSTVSETLKRYEDASSHIKVEYKDPATSPTFYQQYTDSQISSGSLIVTCGEQSKVIDYNDLFESDFDYTTYSSNVTGYDGEGQITSALQYVTSDSMPKIYQVSGHGETTLSGNFSKAIEKANLSSESLNLMDADTVPEDAKCLIINAPTSDFSEDDANKVIDYLNNGGNILVLTNSEATEDLPNFEKIMAAYGISVEKGMIAESDTSMYYQNPFYLLPEVESSLFTSGTSNAYIFAPYAQGISVPEDTDSITYTPLLKTSDNAVIKTDVQNATSYEYEDGDKKGSYAIGLTAQKTIDTDTISTMVVYTSTTMFTDSADQMVSGNNSTLFASTLGQLVDTSEETTGSIVIPVKEYNISTMTVPASTQILYGAAFIVLIPLILVVLGIIIWLKRRKR